MCHLAGETGYAFIAVDAFRVVTATHAHTTSTPPRLAVEVDVEPTGPCMIAAMTGYIKHTDPLMTK